jgi:hypothetical protein
MSQFSDKIAIRTSVFINIVLIAFFITFLIAQVKHTNTSLRIPSGLIRIVIDVIILEAYLDGYRTNMPCGAGILRKHI